MQWESLFGSREIYHDIEKLDGGPHSIKPKYSSVLNIKDSEWVRSGKLLKEWNRNGCIQSLGRLLASQQTGFHSQHVPSMSFLIIHTLPASGISVGMCFCPLPSGLSLIAFLELLDLTVFSCHLSNFNFNFNNLACSKILRVEKTKTQKTWRP